MFKLSSFHLDEQQIADWQSEDVVDGKLFRYMDTGVGLPLIEINEGDLAKLAGREFYEPYWVVAEPPAVFVIFDRERRVIYGPEGFAPGYSLERLLKDEGYDSVAAFRSKHPEALPQANPPDLDVWVRLGLPAKVYVPSLKLKD